MDREELRFTEEMGAVFDRSGWSRMAGRVWGYLLIVDAEQLSATELVDALDASLSSVSSATRELMGLGMLDRIRQPGERRDYFTIHHGSMLNLVRRRFEMVEVLEDLAERGRESFGDRPIAQPHLEELNQVYAWFAQELPLVVERYVEEKGRPERR
jgi:DNA-binding transcriptional regulator GbsR (MarR family)